MLRLVLALLVAAPGVVLAPGAAAQAAYDVTAPTDGLTDDALDAFERGVELLHSFEYDDARDAFRHAQRLAPSAAMPVWGEAMTHNHPVWQRQDADAGRDALARIPAADAASPLAASYLGAVGTLFADGDGKEARDDAYLAAMREHAARFPDDRDGRAFYALALLGSAHEGRDYDVYEQAARIAQSVLDQDPEHPGALHYLIHAYDDPDHAALALPAARAYSEIASAASHALHMPTHIYFALGLWEEASALNQRSYDAAVAASARRGEPLNNHGWHALWWLNYSELQLQRDDRAVALLDTARVRYALDPSGLALRHLVRIRAQTVAETNLPPSDAEELAFGLPRAAMSPDTEAIDLAALLIHSDDPERDLTRLHSLASDPEARPSVRALAFLNPLQTWETPDDAFMASLVEPSVVQSWIAALHVVEATPIAFGPPTPTVLPHEWLALSYMLDGQPDAMRCLLDAAERRAPNRRTTNRIREALAEVRPRALMSTGDRPLLAVPELCSAP